MKVLVGLLILAIISWAGSGRAENALQKMRSKVVEGKKDLSGLKKKIQDEKQQVKAIQRKESSVISQLNILDRNLSKKEKELKALNNRLEVVARRMQKANEDILQLNRAIASQQTFLEGRLVALYKFQDAGMPQVLFSSRSYEDFLSSHRYLTSILVQDRQLIEDYQKRQSLVESYREQLQGDERELQGLKKKAEKKKAEIQVDRSGKARLLDSFRDKKRVHMAALKELETASVQLQALIDRLEKEIRAKAREEIFVSPGKGFGMLRGKLTFPVEGPILSTFGKNENPKFHTFTVQKGVEIEAPTGTEVRAVHEGRVLYSDWFKGYGKILIIDHGEGYYTLSGHASVLLKKVGEEVRAGEAVALVGETGSLKGPCLYFEIRHRGKPLDPLEWLAHRRAR